MNFFLTDIPERTQKPRENGLTMMMDKGLSINDTKNFIDIFRWICCLITFNFSIRSKLIYCNFIDDKTQKIQTFLPLGIQ